MFTQTEFQELKHKPGMQQADCTKRSCLTPLNLEMIEGIAKFRLDGGSFGQNSYPANRQAVTGMNWLSTRCSYSAVYELVHAPA